MEIMPSVRVYTLGWFAVFQNDKPLTFNGRVPKKPLELLRALIAFGGRRVATTKLTPVLWPDTGVDMAKHALETTLYRLRKLLGDRCINTCNGELNIDPNRCWVDVWSVELLFEPSKEISPLARARQLLELYRGPFLDGDDTPSALVQRERLHSKFLRIIGEIGQELETRADYATAIACYQKGIEADPLAEDLYCRLMRCYRRLGRPAEALAVYQRCHKTLTSLLNIEPAM
jgi:LuxR family transcriptional regulator, maltose regulon positive regulatory protein